MEPEEFLTRDTFTQLNEMDQATYLFRFTGALRAAGDQDDEARRLDYLIHYFDLMEWMLPPDEYEKTVRAPLWDLIWRDAEPMREALERARRSPSLSEAERADAAERIETLEALIQHKRDIGALPD